MKLLLGAAEGEAYFHLLDDLRHEVSDLEIIQATGPAEVLGLVGEVDVLYSFPTAEVVAAAPRLRWIQSPSAGWSTWREYRTWSRAQSW